MITEQAYVSVIVCKTLLETPTIEVELKWKKAAFLMGMGFRVLPLEMLKAMLCFRKYRRQKFNSRRRGYPEDIAFGNPGRKENTDSNHGNGEHYLNDYLNYNQR